MGKQSNTGTPKGLDHWVRQLKFEPDADVRLELWCLALEGATPVSSWPWRELLDGGTKEWAERACDTATHDAEGRGRGSRYELRAMLDGRTVACTHLYRTVQVEAEDGGPMTIDGSRDSLVVALMRALERSQTQVIEMSRVAMDGQRATMMLMAQSLQFQGALMQSNLENHTAKLEAEEAALKLSASAPPKNDAFNKMMQMAMPIVAQHLMQEMQRPPPSDREA